MAQRAQLAADDRSGGRLLSCPTLKYIIFKGVFGHFRPSKLPEKLLN